MLPARLAIVLALVACTPRARSEPTAPRDPRLVVLIVIDQLPSWAFDDDVPLLKEGLARLIRDGLYHPHAVYPYAATFTAPGHAALATGAPPAATGILANKWWDRERGRVVESVEDADSPVHGIRGDVPLRGLSPRRLRVDTVGDALKRAYPRAKVVGVSFKDRSAILLAGHAGDLALWYDARQTAFTTSRWYAAEPPAWLRAFAETQDIAGRIQRYVWEPLDPDLLQRATGHGDDGAGEADSYGTGIVFPHRLASAKIPREDVEGTPLSDEIVLEAALAAVEHEDLGGDAVPDLLLVSFSAHDAIAHVWGQESWEALDELLRLDHQIGRLLEALDAQVGAGQYAVVLSSDHGATRTIEQSRARGRPALRVNPETIEVAAEKAAATIAGNGDWIAYSKDPTLYLSDAARALPPEKKDALLDEVARAVGRVDGVGYVERSDRVAGYCDGRGDLISLLCRSIDPERSGEIYYGARADSIVMIPPDEATAHGSANPDDRTVPIVIVAPGIAPRRDDRPVSVLRVAATVAKLLGVPPPPAATRPSL